MGQRGWHHACKQACGEQRCHQGRCFFGVFNKYKPSLGIFKIKKQTFHRQLYMNVRKNRNKRGGIFLYFL
jgi:hypothetical protein